jgi:hypothetical protein
MTSPVPVLQASAQQGVGSTVQDITIALSSVGTISNGDLLVAELSSVAATATTTWSQQVGPTFTKFFENSAASPNGSVWFHICDGTESGSVTFRRSATANNALFVLTRITGADSTTPIAAANVAAGTGTTTPLPDVTATSVNTLSLQTCSFQSISSGVTWTPPGSQTTKFSGQATGTGLAVLVASENLGGTGATGTRTWTHTTSTATRGFHVLINPVASVASNVNPTSVMVGGVEKVVATASVMVGGVEKVVAGTSVMVGGIEKPVA